MPNIKSETMEELRRVLETKKVECPDHRQDCVTRQIRCKGSGSVPDPAVAPLLVLFDDELIAESVRAMGFSGPGGPGVKGVALRYWQAAPESALAGALYYAVNNSQLENQIGLALQSVSNPDQAALEAVLAWAKGKEVRRND